MKIKMQTSMERSEGWSSSTQPQISYWQGARFEWLARWIYFKLFFTQMVKDGIFPCSQKGRPVHSRSRSWNIVERVWVDTLPHTCFSALSCTAHQHAFMCEKIPQHLSISGFSSVKSDRKVTEHSCSTAQLKVIEALSTWCNGTHTTCSSRQSQISCATKLDFMMNVEVYLPECTTRM